MTKSHDQIGFGVGGLDDGISFTT